MELRCWNLRAIFKETSLKQFRFCFCLIISDTCFQRFTKIKAQTFKISVLRQREAIQWLDIKTAEILLINMKGKIRKRWTCNSGWVFSMFSAVSGAKLKLQSSVVYLDEACIGQRRLSWRALQTGFPWKRSGCMHPLPTHMLTHFTCNLTVGTAVSTFFCLSADETLSCFQVTTPSWRSTSACSWSTPLEYSELSLWRHIVTPKAAPDHHRLLFSSTVTFRAQEADVCVWPSNRRCCWRVTSW